MSATLDRFAADCRSALQRNPGRAGLEEVRQLLEALLRDDAFVTEYCLDVKPGLSVLYEDPELHFQVLAHVNEKARVSPPHDHGDSWAVYGQAVEHTDVTEWQRIDDGKDAEKAELKPLKTYRLTRGHAGIYDGDIIHSIDYPDKSCFVRVTGTNLDRIARKSYDLKTGAIKQMAAQRAT